MEMTFQLPDELGREIQDQADSNAFMIQAAEKALLEEWQDEEVRKGLAEADAGELVDHEEVEKQLAKYIIK